jgi:hypothetical protein
MRRFENTLYAFAGIAIGMMIAMSMYEKEVQRMYSVVEVVKKTDFTDSLDDSERGYYEHLYNTK